MTYHITYPPNLDQEWPPAPPALSANHSRHPVGALGHVKACWALFACSPSLRSPCGQVKAKPTRQMIKWIAGQSLVFGFGLCLSDAVALCGRLRFHSG